MSCNGCRVLRKGCSDNCILRQSLQGIDTPQAQANATVFVAKFFGRAGLVSFLSAVPDSQRPALFQSLLFEACGRTVNPVNGAVGLLWTGNWQLCQSAVETVLAGGSLQPMSEFLGNGLSNEGSEIDLFRSATDLFDASKQPTIAADLDLRLTQSFPTVKTGEKKKRRAETPSMNSEESETTTFESGTAAAGYQQGDRETKLLRLFF
ncbi:LOB domain-containing protein 37-like [Impatiens glandulifera]|uniref:LOB domain-containing protein 37-like n=1 Tax=Impatiens glandulifera TaxID=253017 RepID=UPI001FB08F6C|nr:LOB domain-containing protein 37-like [Impatiens glandulifera]